MPADVLVFGGDGPAPQSYEVPNATEVIPKVVCATFDGTGAAGNFVPTVQIISDGGVLVGEVSTDTTVTAGGSATVTFAPFLKAASTGTTTAGLQNDTSPQTGGWFIDTLNGPGGGPNGYAVEWDDTTGNGIAINGVPVFIGDTQEASNGALYSLIGSGHRFDLTINQSFSVRDGYNGPRIFNVVQSNLGNKIGFFGVGPVTQPGTPTTLADVISALQALGLVA